MPHSFVEVETSAAPGNAFTQYLLEEGWEAQLLESNQAIHAYLSDRWKSAPSVHCTLFDPSREEQLYSCGRILKEHGFPSEFGLLVLNMSGSASALLANLQECGFRPFLVAVRDETLEADERCEFYRHLITAGYQFAGTEQKFALWTRAAVVEATKAGTSTAAPPNISDRSGVVCFDTPTTENRFGAAGRLDLPVGGWCFLGVNKPVPPHVYVEVTDSRTGQIEYFPASRHPRLDVAQHFGDPELLLCGFQASIPMDRFFPNGLRLRITQSDGEQSYTSPSELLVDRGNETFETTARQGLARKFLRGSGVEIGALQRKLELPPLCTVRYVDRMLMTDLLQHYPELQNMPLQAPDLVDNGESLMTIAEGSLDFLIANHFFEHSENPIQTLKNLLRVLKPKGILFMAVPDKRYTFDSKRASSKFEVLRATYESGTRANRLELYREWVEFVEQNSVYLEDRLAVLLRENYSIHFNVWSADELFSFLLRARQEFALPFSLTSAVCSDNETIILLERVS